MGKLKHLTCLFIFLMGMSLFCLFYKVTAESNEISKDNIDVSVLLFKANNLNNFKVVDDTIYYVVGDTLYYFNENSGNIPVLKNNELRYNQLNRVAIYRKP